MIICGVFQGSIRMVSELLLSADEKLKVIALNILSVAAYVEPAMYLTVMQALATLKQTIKEDEGAHLCRYVPRVTRPFSGVRCVCVWRGGHSAQY